MLRLASTSLRDILQDILVASNEVHKALGADNERLIHAIVEVQSAVDQLFGSVAQNAHNWVEHRSRDLLERLLRPPLVPDNDALVKQGWVLGAIAREVRVLVVQGNHDIQILLDAADEEFEESPALVLVAHLFLKLGQEWLELLCSVQAWHLTRGEQGVKHCEELIRQKLVVLNV